jgi:hypothetical protein
MSLAKFLTRLHSEVLDHPGEAHNFASLFVRSWQGLLAMAPIV